YRNSGGGYFENAGNHGYWWNATQDIETHAWYHNLNYNNTDVYHFNYNKSYGFSARCVKD
ncbi:MAG: hypothetical protein K8R68_06945, partial [Bacteroidales bacterium]|nr:hypothetical protein [Bacteroidales bacterium]